MSSGYIKVIIATLIFSFSPLVIKLIPLDAISILWTINLVGVVFLGLKLKRENRFGELLNPRKGIFIVFALGLVFTINNALFLSSIKITTIANAMLTHYLAPVFLVFLGALFLKEKIERISIFTLILSLSGLGILLSPNEFALSNTHFMGLALGTLSAIFFAFEITAKKSLSYLFKPDTIAVWCVSLSVIFLLPFVSFSRILNLNAQALAALFLLGIFMTAIGITLFISGLREVKAQRVGILSYLEPLGAIVWSSLFLSEIIPVTAFIGGALILGSGYLVVRQSR